MTCPTEFGSQRESILNLFEFGYVHLCFGSGYMHILEVCDDIGKFFLYISEWG